MSITHLSGPLAVGEDSVRSISSDNGNVALTKDDDGVTFLLSGSGAMTISLPNTSTIKNGFTVSFVVTETPVAADYVILAGGALIRGTIASSELTSAANSPASGGAQVNIKQIVAVVGDSYTIRYLKDTLFSYEQYTVTGTSANQTGVTIT